VTTAPAALGARIIVGVFVGGRGTRMGGAAKGLLPAPDSGLTLIERMLGELRIAVPFAEVVLVGDAELYAGLGLASVADAPPGIGPLGGLLGLLEHAERLGVTQVLALACDLPFVRGEFLSRLLREGGAAVVTETGGVRNPLVARYVVSRALPAARGVLETGGRSLQAVLDRLGNGVVTLALSAAEQASLEDWDTPDDVQRKRGL
jgi:molybdopterin-guanine dinucleotide biosynthesis protein A